MKRIRSAAASRKPRFVLTPLIDVIFLLLIFFMLSSQIAPYALLPVTAAPAAGTGGREPLPTAQQADAADAVLRISRGHVSAGGVTITIDELPAAIDRLKEADISGIVLLTTRSATVQDVVSVLEQFQSAGMPRVRLVAQGRPQ